MQIKINNITLNNSEKADKFCVISDIHHIKTCDDAFYDQIIKKVQTLQAKYILIPGDIVDKPEIIYTRYINYLITFLKKLATIAPVIISKGNHEIKNPKYKVQKLYQKLERIDNIYILDNNEITLGKYHFIGFSPSLCNYLPEFKAKWCENFIKEFNNCHFQKKSNKVTILLCHSPEIITNPQVYENISLLKSVKYIICGHMHNGLAPAFLDKMLASRGLCGPNYVFFPKYCRGVHPLGKDTKLIICKSLRVLTNDNFAFNLLDKLYKRNITVINL